MPRTEERPQETAAAYGPLRCYNLNCVQVFGNDLCRKKMLDFRCLDSAGMTCLLWTHATALQSSPSLSSEKWNMLCLFLVDPAASESICAFIDVTDEIVTDERTSIRQTRRRFWSRRSTGAGGARVKPPKRLRRQWTRYLRKKKTQQA